MRVWRVVAGILTLLLALPVLAAGALGWWTMQHRSPDDAYHATIMPIDAPSRVLVVPDVDALLRRAAPIARADHTTLRLTTPGFLGIARPTDVAAYLGGAGYTAVEGVWLARGSLPVRSQHITASGQRLSKPEDQDFWVRRGEGELSWTPAEDRDHLMTLVIVAPPGSGPIQLTAALIPGWLDSTAWGLLTVGPVLLLLGIAVLAWPTPRREIIYIIDPAIAASSLPALTSGHTVIHVPAQPQPALAVAAADPPERVWPPAEPAEPTEPARDLPMPVAGDHSHLTKVL